MKKLLLIVLLSSFSWGFGQNLSLSQLMSIRTMDIEQAEIFLTQKGWRFQNATERTEDTSEKVRFIYSPNNNLELGEAFLTKYISEFGHDSDAIFLQISKQSKYIEYLNFVKNLNLNLIFAGPKDDQLVKIYRGATLTFDFAAGTTTNGYGDTKSAWFLYITRNQL